MLDSQQTASEVLFIPFESDSLPVSFPYKTAMSSCQVVAFFFDLMFTVVDLKKLRLVHIKSNMTKCTTIYFYTINPLFARPDICLSWQSTSVYLKLKKEQCSPIKVAMFFCFFSLSHAIIFNLAWQLEHYDFNSENLVMNLAKLQQKAFSGSLRISLPVKIWGVFFFLFLVLTKAQSNRCLKPPEEDEGKIQETTARVCAAKEINIDAATAGSHLCITGITKYRAGGLSSVRV